MSYIEPSVYVILVTAHGPHDSYPVTTLVGASRTEPFVTEADADAAAASLTAKLHEPNLSVVSYPLTALAEMFG